MQIEYPAFQIREAGAPSARLVLDVRTVVLPAVYAAGGAPVDLSAAFSRLAGIIILRAFDTATGAADARRYLVHEAGTDTFANRKFRLQAMRISQPTFTGNALAVHSHNLTFGGGGSVACEVAGVACTKAGHPANPTDSTSAGTPAGTVSRPAHEEEAAGTDLSTITVQFLAIGVPA